MAVSHDRRSLATALRDKLAVDGHPRIIWEHEGDAVLVHLDALQVELRSGILIVSLPLETDQTGRHELRTSFAIGVGGGEMLSVTEELPEGHDGLVARWGQVLQQALWWALVELVDDPRKPTRDVAVTVDLQRERVAWNWRPRRRPP